MDCQIEETSGSQASYRRKAIIMMTWPGPWLLKGFCCTTVPPPPVSTCTGEKIEQFARMKWTVKSDQKSMCVKLGQANLGEIWSNFFLLQTLIAKNLSRKTNGIIINLLHTLTIREGLKHRKSCE